MNSHAEIPHDDASGVLDIDDRFIHLSEQNPKLDNERPMTEQSAIARLTEIRQERKKINERLATLKPQLPVALGLPPFTALHHPVDTKGLPEAERIKSDILGLEQALKGLNNDEHMLRKKFPKIAHIIFPRGT